MSDHFLVLIPEQPTYVPSPEAQSRAVDVLRALVPRATKVEARLAEHVEFIDQGANFEKVSCPACGEDLTDRWPSWMDEAARSNFSELSVITPCCGRATDLNALRYVWPAGFARFALRAENPAVGGFLALSDLSVLEGVVGCKLRQVPDALLNGSTKPHGERRAPQVSPPPGTPSDLARRRCAVG